MDLWGVRVTYRLLGELVIGGDQPMELPTGHTLAVLAALLINANQRMSKSELLAAAWGSADVSEAQLHKAAAALRALLGTIGRRSDLVTYARYGYEMRVGDDDLDMLRFKRLQLQADQARTERRPDDEAGLLRQALGQWRGQHPLSNVPGSAFTQEMAVLEQRRKRAAARLFDLELARGAYEGVLDELALIAGYYPEDGRLAEQLMIASYRCGHVTDATSAFERHAAALVEQTGGNPDPALRALYYAVASGDDQPVVAAESAVARRAGLPGVGGGAIRGLAVPRQLPPDPDLIGRDDLVAEATWLLGREPGRHAQVMVISGPGGIGKTALARRVAHLSAERYTDGQLHMEMRGTAGQRTEPAEALAQFLRALGAPVVPESLAERVATYRTLLADRKVLVVLDDAADGAQVRDLIPASPTCGVLITARRRLPDIDGAHHVPPLGPLSRADATELFLRVARNAGIDLRAEQDAVGKVVALCGGLPLALLIAAALRVRDHPRPTSELADRLARQGPEAFTFEDFSVARTIGAGYERLDQDARRLFLRLGTLALPSFGLWTVAALDGDTVVNDTAALWQLAASHMIEPAPSQLRYRFHDLTRDYAARRAQAEQGSHDGDLAMLASVYRALLTLTRRAHVGLYGGDFEVVHSDVPDWDAPEAVLAEVDADPQAWFEMERLNIRAAVSHCAKLGLTSICWDLAISAHEFYTRCKYYDDWRATHTIALRACKMAGDQRGEGIVLACLGQPTLVASLGEGTSGVAELERSVELLAASGDRHGQAISMRTLGNALRRKGHLTQALRVFNEALAHYEASGDVVGVAQSLRYIGQTHLDRGDAAAAALVALNSARDLASGLPDPLPVGQVTYWIGQAFLAAGDPSGAAGAFAAMFGLFTGPAGLGHAYAEHGLGEVALRACAYSEAGPRLRRAAELARDGADATLEGRVCLSLAELHEALGEQPERIAALERAVDCFGGLGNAYQQARALAALARAHDDAGDTSAARAARAQVDAIYQDVPAEDRGCGAAS
jgi:DNA-binding SARP family transcriptional activator/tetratricopeptide (TPR) repeat protein